MKNGKIANINVSKKDLFMRWIEITRPFHKLTSQHSNVLGLLLYHHHTFGKSISDNDLAWKATFSYDTKAEIKEELDIKGQHLQNILSTLRKKNIIKNNQVIDAYVPNVEQDAKSFSIMFKLNIVADE